MFVRCPACKTLFRIQPRQLKAARGQVRCGSCKAVFDSLDFLVNPDEMNKEELAALSKPAEVQTGQWPLPFDESPAPAASPAEVEQPAVGSPPPIETSAQKASGLPGKATEEAAPSSGSQPAPLEPEPVTPPPAPPPPVKIRLKPPRYSLSDSEPEPAPKHTAARIGWALGSLLMIVVLAGQIVFHNRDTLSLDPHWRPWFQMLCDRAGCELPPQRDPGAIEMVDRNVQSHPKYQNALLITATLVNQAPFPQPYPLVELSMTDLDQKRIASRLFKPSEYVDGGNGKGLIPPGGSVRLKLEIADPGQEAVGFEFEFY